MIRIGFHGAAETVTGSRHLLQINGKQILVDCGMFQGRREIRERNWLPFPVQPHSIDAVVITHAHMDHIGYLPRLIAHGYQGPVYATKATIQLAGISLPDSGRLQEEDARYRNKHKHTRHSPALPLYTEKEAYNSLKQFEPVPYNEMFGLPGGVTMRYLPAGHILGSAFAEIYFPNGERILMSGDLGRYDMPVIADPTSVEYAEYLVVESTYGDRIHSDEHPMDVLEEVMKEAVQHGSAVIVPSFAIGRTQELLYFISMLQDQGRVPRIPVFVDSPMATSVTSVYRTAKDEHDPEMKLALKEGDNPLEPHGMSFIRDRNQSKALNVQPGPMMIISGSGMANGGRVVHHLRRRLSDPNTIVLFTGFQAEGTLGRRILEGEPEVEIFGDPIPVRASVRKINSLSAHADQAEIMKWLGGFKTPPKKTFIVHGEPHAQGVLHQLIREQLGWDVVIPKHGEEFALA